MNAPRLSRSIQVDLDSGLSSPAPAGERVQLRTQRASFGQLGVRHLWPLWVAVGLLMYEGLASFARYGQYGIDSHAYWLTGHHADLYGRAASTVDAYLYSPAFAQLIRPLALMPWPAFYTVWVCVEAAAFVWLLKPLGWAWGVPAFLLCGFEIYQGNVIGLLGVALVAGMGRLPEAWAFAALTKVTIALGPVWFAARGEWRRLARAAIATALIATVSAAVDPGGWRSWVHLLTAHQDVDPTLPIRIAGAIGITAFAARRDKRWLLVPAMVLATPVTHGLGQYLTLFAAVPRLRGQRLTPTSGGVDA